MIYTRFGSPCEIVEYIGEDEGMNALYEQISGEWVTIKYLNRPHVSREALVSELRADNGFNEIVAAIEQLKP